MSHITDASIFPCPFPKGLWAGVSSPVMNISGRSRSGCRRRWNAEGGLEPVLGPASPAANRPRRSRRRSQEIYVVTCEEVYTVLDPQTNTPQDRRALHAWVSSKPLNRNNFHARRNLIGRRRWAIENNILVEKHHGCAYDHPSAPSTPHNLPPLKLVVLPPPPLPPAEHGHTSGPDSLRTHFTPHRTNI